MTDYDYYDTIYESPERFGLAKVGDLGDGGYDWSTLAVWQSTTDGKMYWGQDSGCSCNSPWEGVRDTNDLRDLTTQTWDEFARDVKEFCRGPYSYASPDEGVKLLAAIKPMVPRG